VPNVKPLRLSEEIDRLVAAFAKRRVRLREILDITRGRGYTLLLALLALPFCTPTPLPGLSTPFGVVIALIGFRLSLREKPWLPERLLDTELPPKFFPGFLSATRWLVKGMEFFLRPRWTWLLDAGVLHHAYGAIILVCGALLLLPLPIPLSNTLPALTVVLLAAAMLERDGYFVVAGLVIFAATLGYFGSLVFGGAAIAHWLYQ
jgi:hypothetical protein